MHQTYTSTLITNYGKYPIVFQGVIIRNNLPTYIGIVILYDMFQNKLKKYGQNYNKVHSDFFLIRLKIYQLRIIFPYLYCKTESPVSVKSYASSLSRIKRGFQSKRLTEFA